MNYRILIIGTLLTAFLTSCDIKGQQEPDFKIGDISLYAYGKNLSWEQNDSISVFDGYANHKYTAEFNGDTSKFVSKSTLSEDSFDLYAVYPYDSEVIRTESGLNIDFPSEQNVSISGIDPSADIYVAYTKDLENNTFLKLYQICSYFSFSVKKEYGIVKVILTGSENEYLAGKVNVTFSDKEPQISLLEGCQEVCVSSKTAMDGTYQVCVLPSVLQNGLTVNFVSAEGKTAQERIVAKVEGDIETAMVFVRGRVNSSPIEFENPFPVIPEEPSPEDPAPENPTPENPKPEDPENPEEPTPEDPENPTPEDPTPENPEEPTPENPADPENPEEPAPEDPVNPDNGINSNVENYINQELPDDLWN